MAETYNIPTIIKGDTFRALQFTVTLNSVALDLPTQLGLDSDDPLSLGEVGRVGVAIDSLADIETLMEGIPLEKISQVRTTANSIGYIWAAMFIALAEQRGVDPNNQETVLRRFIKIVSEHATINKMSICLLKYFEDNTLIIPIDENEINNIYSKIEANYNSKQTIPNLKRLIKENTDLIKTHEIQINEFQAKMNKIENSLSPLMINKKEIINKNGDLNQMVEIYAKKIEDIKKKHQK